MAFKGYKQNPLYKSMTEAAYGLAKTLPSRSKKAVDVSRFRGIPATVSKAGATPTAATPASLKGLGATITTPYGGSTKFEKFHRGIDLATTYGKDLPALTGGVVSKVVTGKGWTPSQPGFGNRVIITDAHGGQHYYSHLAQGFINVKAGDVVKRGDIIGKIGSSGGAYSRRDPSSRAAASHLDYRIRDNFFRFVSPIDYLSKYQYK